MVNWKAIYDLVYVFYINFDHKMYRLWYTTCCKFCDFYLIFKSKAKGLVWRSYVRTLHNIYVTVV